MDIRSRRASFALPFAFVGALLSAVPDRPEGELRFSLSGDSFEAHVDLGSRNSYFTALAFRATEEGAFLRAGMSLGEEEGEGRGAFVAVGPGRAAGSLRLLADPLSYAAIAARGGPVALDPSLGAGTAVLGTRAHAESGGYSAFALASGAEAGLLFSRAGLAQEAGLVLPRSAAAGLLFTLDGGALKEGGTCSAASAAALRRGSEGGGGWEPDPSPDPAGLVLLGALLRERRGAFGRTLFGLAATFGRLEGPGLAARVEAEAREGPFFFRVAAARASAGFRDLSGSVPERSLAAAADIRLVLRRASALSLSLRLESPRARAGEPPLLGSSSRIGLSLPAGGGVRVLEPRIEISRKPGEDVEAELGFAIRGRRGGGGTNLDLALGFDGEEGIRCLQASLVSGVADEALGLGLELDLGLSCLEGGEITAPVLAEAALRLSLRLPGPSKEGAELRIEASGPEAGFVLAPIAAGASLPGFELSLRYVVDF